MVPGTPWGGLLALLLAIGLSGGGVARGQSPVIGGDPCELIEGLPGKDAPLRRVPALAGAFRHLARAGTDPKRNQRVHRDLAKALTRLLAQAARVFHPDDSPRRWSDAKRKRAQRYLRKHVLGRVPVLRVGRVGFEPQPGLRAALMASACWAGNRGAALRYGRGATAPDEGAARAFAATLLLVDGRAAEAIELVDGLDGDGFLASWVTAELASDPTVRFAAHARAKRRISSPAQERAIRAQEERWSRQPPEGGETP